MREIKKITQIMYLFVFNCVQQFHDLIWFTMFKNRIMSNSIVQIIYFYFIEINQRIFKTKYVIETTANKAKQANKKNNR